MTDLPQILTVFFAVLGGFEMVRRSTAHALEVHTSNISKLLRGKIDVEEYRAKTATLHAEINDLRVKVAILEDRNAQR